MPPNRPMGLLIMFSRMLLTVASLMVALAAALVIDCSTSVIDILDDDPTGVCSAVGSLGEAGGLVVGGVLAALAMVALIVTWLPSAIPGVQVRRAEPTSSLMHNLGRLAGMRSLGHEPVPLGVSRSHLAELSRRLEIVETALETETSVSARATELWMRMLKEANDLHNSGELVTEDFKKINTRLVDVFAPSEETSQEEMEGSSAAH